MSYSSNFAKWTVKEGKFWISLERYFSISGDSFTLHPFIATWNKKCFEITFHILNISLSNWLCYLKLRCIFESFKIWSLLFFNFEFHFLTLSKYSVKYFDGRSPKHGWIDFKLYVYMFQLVIDDCNFLYLLSQKVEHKPNIINTVFICQLYQ